MQQHVEFLVKDISKDFHYKEILNEALRTVSYPRTKEAYGGQWTTTLALLPVHKHGHGLFKHDGSKLRVVLYQRLATSEEEHSFVLCRGEHQRYVERAFHQLDSTLRPLVEEGEVQLVPALLNAAVLPRPKTVQQLSRDLVEVIQKEGLTSEKYWISVNKALENYRVGTEEPDGPIDRRRRLQRAASLNQHQLIWKELDHQLLKRSFDVPLSELLDQSEQDELPALQLAASSGYFESCQALLLAGSEVNYTHPITGNTALHLAVEDHRIVKLLICFDADVTIANFKGETALDKAKMSESKNAKKSVSFIEEVLDLQAKCTAYYNLLKSLPDPASTEGKTYLLSLDGGGMRGVIITITLMHIENRMKQLDPNCGPLASYFDYIAGTSAGGICALLLGHAGTSLETTGLFLFRTLTDVFMKPRAERGRRLEELLREFLGDDTKMADHIDTRVIVPTTLYTHNPPNLHLMCNYGPARDGLPGPEERLAWEAACASTAAPHYFPCFRGKFLDGGLMANNPTLIAMSEIVSQAEREGKRAELGLVVSVGTGVPPPEPVKDIEFFLSNPLQVLSKSLVSGITNLLQLFVSQVTESNGQQVQIASAVCQQMNTPYVRLSPPIPHDYALDTCNVDQLLEVSYSSYKYLLKEHEAIDRCAKLLLARKCQK